MEAIKEITRQQLDKMSGSGLKPPHCPKCGREAELRIMVSEIKKGRFMVCCKYCAHKEDAMIPTEWLHDGQRLLSLESENSLAKAITEVLNTWDDYVNSYVKTHVQGGDLIGYKVP